MYRAYKAICSTGKVTAAPQRVSTKDHPPTEMASCDKSSTAKSFKSSVVIIPPKELWDQIQDIRRLHDKSFERWMPHINLVYPFIHDDDDHKDSFDEAQPAFRKALSTMQPFHVKFTRDSFQFFRHRKSCTLWLKPLWEGMEAEDKSAAEAPIGNQQSTFRPDSNAEADQVKGQGAFGGAACGPPSYEEPDILQGLSKSQAKRERMKMKEEERKQEELRSIGVLHPHILELQKCLVQQYPKFNDVNVISERGFIPHLSVGQFSERELLRHKERFENDWHDIEFDVKEIFLISRKDFSDPFHIRHVVPLGENAE